MHGAHRDDRERILEMKESRENLIVVGLDVRVHDSIEPTWQLVLASGSGSQLQKSPKQTVLPALNVPS